MGEMVKINTSDILAWGMIAMSIYLFLDALNQPVMWMKLFGLLASVIIFISEVVYLVQKYER